MAVQQNVYQSSFVDSLLQPIAKKQESYIKDTTHFINFENTKIPDKAILATLDVCSLYTNVPQEEGIKVICQYYEEYYQSKPPIPTSTLGELMRLILKENSFQFSGKHYLQTHGIAMGTKMAVAFVVIFMAHIKKQLLAASPFKPTLWKRFIDDIFTVRTISEQEINDFVSFVNISTQPSNLHAKCHLSVLFSSTLKFLKDPVSPSAKHLMSKHILSPQNFPIYAFLLMSPSQS